jgi:hypothetical protein
MVEPFNTCVQIRVRRTQMAHLFCGFPGCAQIFCLHYGIDLASEVPLIVARSFLVDTVLQLPKLLSLFKTT